MGTDRDRTVEPLADLVGRVVTKIEANEDTSLLVFHTDEGVIAYRAIGDCCSDAWFHHLSGSDVILPDASCPGIDKTIRSTTASAWYPTPATKQRVEEFAFLTLTTVWGRCVIETRSSSNGYYNAEIRRDDIYLPAPHREEWEADVLHPITEDF